MSLKYDSIIEMMKDDIAVFRNISLESLRESLQVFRIFELREKEALLLTSSEVEDYLFVLLGEIEVHTAHDLVHRVVPRDTHESPVLLPKLPETTQVVAIEDSYVVHVDNVLFEHLQILDQSVAHLATDLQLPTEYLARVRDSGIFQRLPVEAAEKAMGAFETVHASAGQDVIHSGEVSDTFFVLVAGTAELRRGDGTADGRGSVTQLGAGDWFGEDALLTGQGGSEAVRALEDCTMLALTRGDFEELLVKPLVPCVTPAVADAMLGEAGCQALDVRHAAEYRKLHIPGAVRVAFHELLDHLDELDRAKRYVAYCNSGKLGAAAAYSLGKLGYDVVNLEGGFREWQRSHTPAHRGIVFENEAELRERIELLARRRVPGKVPIFEDATQLMNIVGGTVLRLEGNDYFVMGDAKEGRFGIDDQPKFWVKYAIDLSNGARKVIKLVFHEQITAQIGDSRVRCVRSPDKESAVLSLTRGDPRFMQGVTVRDHDGNNIRVIDYIRGTSFLNHVAAINLPHEEYYYEMLPGILTRLLGSIEAIGFLHRNGMEHGDIRNDHLMVEAGTGEYRWIDFDYGVNQSDYDIWSVGNLLAFAVGKGFVNCRDVAEHLAHRGGPSAALDEDDALYVFHHRLANLRKFYPYIDASLNDLLQRFSVGSRAPLEGFDEMCEQLRLAIAELDDPGLVVPGN